MSDASELVIRRATEADDVAVGELLVEAFVQGYAAKMPEVVLPEERFRELRAVAAKRQIALVLVAELGGEVVGTVALFPPGAPGSEAWLPHAADLRHLGISPRLHGRGLSAHLLDAAEAEAKQLGARAVCLHVRRGAHGVRRLYERRGYVRDEKGDLDLPSVSLEAFTRSLG